MLYARTKILYTASAFSELLYVVPALCHGSGQGRILVVPSEGPLDLLLWKPDATIGADPRDEVSDAQDLQYFVY